MAAPDRATLYNIEDAVEAACKAIIASSDITAPCYAQRESTDLPDHRIDIQLRLGPVFMGREDSWQAELVFNIWTDRTVQDATTNGTLRGYLRHLFGRVPRGGDHPLFPEEILPYHVICKMAHSGTDPQVNVADDLDVSALHYDVVVSLREGSFPTDDEA